MSELAQKNAQTGNAEAQETNYVFMDGEVVQYENAKISVRTPTLSYMEHLFLKA
ncbi:MAG: hypothetical protein MZU79_02060 [Anaerotruncus sp.]|nr:hypothetical protein [Anaerotruncus sp.]